MQSCRIHNEVLTHLKAIIPRKELNFFVFKHKRIFFSKFQLCLQCDLSYKIKDLNLECKKKPTETRRQWFSDMHICKFFRGVCQNSVVHRSKIWGWKATELGILLWQNRQQNHLQPYINKRTRLLLKPHTWNYPLIKSMTLSSRRWLLPEMYRSSTMHLLKKKTTGRRTSWSEERTGHSGIEAEQKREVAGPFSDGGKKNCWRQKIRRVAGRWNFFLGQRVRVDLSKPKSSHANNSDQRVKKLPVSATSFSQWTFIPWITMSCLAIGVICTFVGHALPP